MSAVIRIHDKFFEPFLSAEQISERVRAIGEALSVAYAGKDPVLLVLLKGSFIFAADLFRALTIPAEVAFVRLSSYEGTRPGETVQLHWPPDESLRGRHIIVVEDIIDSGATLSFFLPELQALEPAGVSIVTLLFKPDALRYPDLKAAYTGFEIPDRFVVGYGLDYDGYGRNLPALYCPHEN